MAVSQPGDELAQAEIAGRDDIEAALAVERKTGDRPAADARQRAKPRPGPLVVGLAVPTRPLRTTAPSGSAAKVAPVKVPFELQRAMSLPSYVPGPMSVLERALHHFVNGHLDRIVPEGATRTAAE